MNIGYSTGSLAYGDFRKGISLLKKTNAIAIELSSLRECELIDLVNSLNSVDLSGFSYISFHAPSRLIDFSEKEVIQLLLKVAEREWPIIVHPDIITDIGEWKKLGRFLCLENMDKRKPIGQTFVDLDILFNCFPEATFCLDIAHSKQIDPTMLETRCMLQKFKHRLKQVHVSEVNSNSKHELLNIEAIKSYQKVASLIPDSIPIILESPEPVSILHEMQMASYIFDPNYKLESTFGSMELLTTRKLVQERSLGIL
ncbi:MAG: hypothetical protein JWQ09_671 [Segetibacter sp.]|nr:hypothetical protein [Segetibacter sp.]